MRKLAIATSHDQHGQPLRSCICTPGGKAEIVSMYAKGTGYTRHFVKHTQMALIRKLFERARTGQLQIITHNFKRHLEVFNLPLRLDDEPCSYDVYDIPDYKDVPDDKLEEVARQLMAAELSEYQRIRANSAVAYRDMERAGLRHNGILRHPIWNQYVITGRTSCTGFNLQNIPKTDQVDHVIHHPEDSEGHYLLHYDWIAADIRMAAYLADDDLLLESFDRSDPYSLLMDLLDRPRDQCKKELLAGIHGLHLNSDVFLVYKKLKKWIMACKEVVDDPNAYLETILGRKFRVGVLKDRKRAVSYVVQGSTAHAMQLAVRKIWELHGVRVLADVHDGLVVSCPAGDCEAAIRSAGYIMANPFNGMLDISMPYRVDMCKVSKGWNNWKPMLEYRCGKFRSLRNASPRSAPAAEAAAPPQAEGAPAEES